MSRFWNGISAEKKECLDIYPALGRYKSEEFIRLIKKWFNNLGSVKVLKTDLWEEAFGDDQILFSLMSEKIKIFAVDISENITKRASSVKSGKGMCQHYLTADVRSLPFKTGAFDLILSTSTLDHFRNDDDLKGSLLELKRMLNKSGSMIIAINNKHNPFFHLSLSLGRLLGVIPYPIRFYRLQELRAIFKESGLVIKDYDCIVHIVGPLNTAAILLKKLLGDRIVNRLMICFVYFATWLGKRKRTKFLTGWFLVFKCVAA